MSLHWVYSDSFLGVRLVHPSVIFIGCTATSGGCGLRVGRVAFCTIPGIKITIGCTATKPLAGSIRCSGTWPHGNLLVEVFDCQCTCWPFPTCIQFRMPGMPAYIQDPASLSTTLWYRMNVFHVTHGPHGLVAWPHQFLLLHLSLSLWCLPHLASNSLELCQICLTKKINN